MVRFVCTQDHTLHRQHSHASLHCVLKCVNTFTLLFLSVHFSKNKTAYTVKQENRQISTSLLLKQKRENRLWKSVCTHSSSAQHFDTGTTSIISIGGEKTESVKRLTCNTKTLHTRNEQQQWLFIPSTHDAAASTKKERIFKVPINFEKWMPHRYWFLFWIVKSTKMIGNFVWHLMQITMMICKKPLYGFRLVNCINILWKKPNRTAFMQIFD